MRAAFENPTEFTTSPLYRALSRTVAASDQLLGLAHPVARDGHGGQIPGIILC